MMSTPEFTSNAARNFGKKKMGKKYFKPVPEHGDKATNSTLLLCVHA